MEEVKKESFRWFLQAEDDFRFVEWVKEEGFFSITAVSGPGSPAKRPCNPAFLHGRSGVPLDILSSRWLPD